MAARAGDVRNKADAAGVALLIWIVEMSVLVHSYFTHVRRWQTVYHISQSLIGAAQLSMR